MPLSLVGTFGVMVLLGFSLNNLSLMALTISTGFVVDDAIVMIENIARYVEAGEEPLAAPLKGAEQIGFTILSLTVSLVAVLIPLLFMADVVGRLFREFAVTLGVTILISAVVSLTLTPMMCARLLRHTPPERQGRIYRWSERVFELVVQRYGSTLKWVLGHQTATLGVAAATLVLTIVLYVIVPKGFFPAQDTGLIHGISEAPQSVSFPAMAERQHALAQVILKDPAVASLSSFIGVDGTNVTLNSGRILINLKPLSERKVSASEVIRRLGPALQSVDGITLFMQPVQDLSVESRVSRTQYQYSLEDPDGAELNVWAPKLVEALRAETALRDVSSDQQDQGLLTIDRATASRLGVSPLTIDNTLYDAFGQRQVSTMFTQLNQYRVVLEVQPAFRKNRAALRDIYVRGTGSSSTSAGPAGTGIASSTAATAPPTAPATSVAPATAVVPLTAVTQAVETTAPLAIARQGQFPAVTLSFNLAPRASLGEAVRVIEAATQKLGLPPSIQGNFQGTAEAFRASLSSEPLLILAALVAV